MGVGGGSVGLGAHLDGGAEDKFELLFSDQSLFVETMHVVFDVESQCQNLNG